MATDFFERQDIARRNTARLVFIFVLAVLAIIVAVDLLLGVTFGYLVREPGTGAIDLVLDPRILAVAVIGTLVIVAGGSAYKVAELWGGGRVVAEQLGGRLLNSNSTVSFERQLLNVVEEMSIASGTTTPPVYLLDNEEAINAFAAGFTPSDAVIGVTRGTAERLSRDELQGVIAHEFSHILNGDMRLNIRLIGLLHGILILGLIGHFLLRVALHSGHGRRRSRDRGTVPLLGLGAGLAAIGFVGTFFGSMIKAAVSRQREFLADASAVQFTRYPAGISGALKKIGGRLVGSTIESPNAPEASHMFFGRATSGLTSLFSTHPPLGERIRRLDPSWDGAFVESEPLAGDVGARQPMVPGVAGLADVSRGEPEVTAPFTRAIGDIGQPTSAHLDYAARLLDDVPAPLVDAAREPYGARAVVYAMLIDRQADARRQQLEYLLGAADTGVFDETMRLLPAVEHIELRARFPLVEISVPALGALPRAEYHQFRRNVVELVQADETISLFEWSLQRILMHALDGRHAEVTPPRIRHQTLDHLGPSCEALVSTLAHVGHHDARVAATAFAQGWQQLELPPARLRPLEASGLDVLDGAIGELEAAPPQIKRQVLQAAAACIAADQNITAYEAELLRAISAALGCPMPPLLSV